MKKKNNLKQLYLTLVFSGEPDAPYSVNMLASDLGEMLLSPKFKDYYIKSIKTIINNINFGYKLICVFKKNI